MIEYRIYQSVYDEMTIGKKNIEIRLLNEKSKKIKLGDKIKFQVLDSDLYLIVVILIAIVGVGVYFLFKNS